MTSQSKKDKNIRQTPTSFSYDNGFYSKSASTSLENNQDYVQQGLMSLSGFQSASYTSVSANHDDYGGQDTFVPSSAIDTTRRRNVEARNVASAGAQYNFEINSERYQQNTLNNDLLQNHHVPNSNNIHASEYNEMTTISKRKRRTQRLKSTQVQKKKMNQKSFSFLHLNKEMDIVLYAAVLLWYLLGVLSISTTKVLLRDYSSSGVTPLSLTLQQLFIGLFFLRSWIYMSGKDPLAISYKNLWTFSKRKNSEYHGYDKLVLSAIFFTVGFWLTNLSFYGADASFVETIKASEPITSAALAVLWGIEQLSLKEATSLVGIILGVVISTLGNAHGAIETKDLHSTVSLAQSFYQSGIVMSGNLCFSFRGLYQKLFRSCPNGNKDMMDDVNLQYRFHQIGIAVLIIPLLLYEFPSVVRYWLGYDSERHSVGPSLWTYCGLSIVNAFAFTHYNFASSFVLTRISVVRHAALNCLRRLFAIVVASFIFSVPITILSQMGIFVSIVGFLLFTKYKVERKNQSRRQTSLLPVTSR